MTSTADLLSTSVVSTVLTAYNYPTLEQSLLQPTSEIVYANYNALTDIPDVLLHLPRLTTVDLTGNLLCELDGSAVGI